ncbi:hypothetical protein [Aliivibrio fischeri]|uniref:hypothetical protein n=1 Tax=Aliivibrio fischeri TaxID=668 RepID=UPI0007C4A01C|nr:hypothetical protein [Aliivibrio fischeri]
MNKIENQLNALYEQYNQINKKLNLAREKNDHSLYQKLLEEEGQLIDRVDSLKADANKNRTESKNITPSPSKLTIAKRPKEPSGKAVAKKIISLFIKQFVGARTFKEIYSTIESNKTNKEILEAIWKQAQGDLTWRFDLYSLTSFDDAVMSYYRNIKVNNEDKQRMATTEYQECLNLIRAIKNGKSTTLTASDLKGRARTFKNLLEKDVIECKTEIKRFIQRYDLNLDYDKATDTSTIKESVGMQLSLL